MFGLDTDPDPHRTLFERTRSALLSDLVDWLHTQPDTAAVDETVGETISALRQIADLYRQ